MITAAHLATARSIARGVHSSIPANAGIELDDLIGAAYLGLAKAARAWNGITKFEAFAYRPIKGAVIDELRSQSPLSRGALAEQRKVREIEEPLAQRLKRWPTRNEAAHAAGVPHDRVAHADELNWPARFDSPLLLVQSAGSEDGTMHDVIEDPAAPHWAPPPERFVDLIAGLDARAQLALTMRHVDEAEQQDIGDVLGLDRSTVSLILTRAHATLRARLEAA